MPIDTSNCIFPSVSIFSADQVALFSRNETSSNELEKGLRGIIFLRVLDPYEGRDYSSLFRSCFGKFVGEPIRNISQRNS